MATLVPIPKLGQSEETVSIVKWHKAEGDTVAKGDVLFEVETDKAVLEVESQFEGTLLKIAVPEGREVPVMTVAAVLGEPGEAIPPIPPPPKPESGEKKPGVPAPSPAPSAATRKPSAAPLAPSAAAAPASGAVLPAGPPKRKTISPRARKFAEGFLIRVEDVSGTGPGGRVVQRDVEAYLERIGYFARKITPAARNLAARLGLGITEIEATGMSGRITVADVRRAELDRPKPMSRIRQIIARRLQQAKQTIPHFYVTVSVDMTTLVNYRRKLRSAGYPLSLNDFVIKAVAAALSEHPALESHTDDGVHVRRSTHVNIGLAVSIENGLVVPVLHRADRMELDELHDAVKELADKARTGKLTPEEMSGGVFTVSNMGMLNVENFAAIINPGESGILAVSSVQPVPVADPERNVVVRDMMKITLSADHRVVDGAEGAAFVNTVRRYLEDSTFWEQLTGISAEGV
ncbi:MAG: 2-oxo acid dehydrogenase subunit E2 [Kiritimatiellaeota bacterium]|nr:2-oxo acid dehydrogenase subunit E2 [Kiritimatiellota bacterium]